MARPAARAAVRRRVLDGARGALARRAALARARPARLPAGAAGRVRLCAGSSVDWRFIHVLHYCKDCQPF